MSYKVKYRWPGKWLTESSVLKWLNSLDPISVLCHLASPSSSFLSIPSVPFSVKHHSAG